MEETEGIALQLTDEPWIQTHHQSIEMGDTDW
jgi:hypothetical protein